MTPGSLTSPTLWLSEPTMKYSARRHLAEKCCKGAIAPHPAIRPSGPQEEQQATTVIGTSPGHVDRRAAHIFDEPLEATSGLFPTKSGSHECAGALRDGRAHRFAA